MNKVCLEHIEPGMVLAMDVKGADGTVVLQKGAALDDESYQILEDAGAGFVFVDRPAGDEGTQALARQVEEYVHRFFLYVDHDNPAFGELYGLTAEATYKAAADGWELPCLSEVMAKNVERMKDLFHKDLGTPQDLVKHETQLASFPDIYFRIREELDSDTSTAESIAKVVSSDVGLSAKLLQLVNSPFFGTVTTVDSVSRAVSLVGFRELGMLAMGISTINFFQDIPPELIDMKSFWTHSLSCGIYGKLIASKIGGLAEERFFTAGLLHDCGRLVMFKNMPYASTQAMLYARENTVPLVEAEQEILGFDHTEVGSLLLQEWQFPAPLTNIITNHHDPGNSEESLDAAIIQLADNMANASGVPTGGMYILPGMEQADWDSLELDAGDLARIVKLHDSSIEEIAKVFLS